MDWRLDKKLVCGLLVFPVLTCLGKPTACSTAQPLQIQAKSKLTLSYKLHPRKASWPGRSAKKKIINSTFKTESSTMQFLQFSVLSISSILITLTIGRPRIETSNSNSISMSNTLQMSASSTKAPLSTCEEAVYSCCSSQWSTFQQSARCFELNNCPGINFIANPCLRLSSVINRIWSEWQKNIVPSNFIEVFNSKMKCLIVKNFNLRCSRTSCHCLIQWYWSKHVKSGRSQPPVSRCAKRGLQAKSWSQEGS